MTEIQERLESRKEWDDESTFNVFALKSQELRGGHL